MKRIREIEIEEGDRRLYRRIELPTIVCLCGSTRFYKEFQRVNYEKSMVGKIVLSVGFYMHETEAAHGEKWGCTHEQKEMLDHLHLKKIDLADEVFIINVDGYVGDSTMSEIAYALWRRKELYWLEEPVGGTDAWVCDHKNELGKLIAKHSGLVPPRNEKIITLDEDIEGLGKTGEQVPLSRLLEWGAAEGFRLGYHHKAADEVPQLVTGRSPHVLEDDEQEQDGD